MAAILLISNTSWNILNFRMGLARSLRRQGYDVILVAPRDSYTEALISTGFPYVALPMNRTGTNPFQELRSLLAIWKIVRDHKPDGMLLFTPKPNVYGGIISRLTDVPALHNVAGLGRLFMRRKSLKARLAAMLYRISMRNSAYVFFQNDTDRAFLVDTGAVRSAKSKRIFGSGVDTDHFDPSLKPLARTRPEFDFLLSARMLHPKGIGEYVAAAAQIRKTNPKVRFGLLGPIVADDPVGYLPEEIRKFEQESGVEYLGETRDVRHWLARSCCVVLPSYYGEGVPRSLLEAASMERPIISTDSVGCRDAVVDGVTGWLVAPKDVEALRKKMAEFLELSMERRRKFGIAAREMMERSFREDRIFREYQSQLAAILPDRAVDIEQDAELAKSGARPYRPVNA